MTEQKPMRQIKIESHKTTSRQHIIPHQPIHNPICNPGHQRPHRTRRPHQRHNPHIPILIILMRLGIPTGYPRERRSSKLILDRREVGVVLDRHDELHVQAVAGFGPDAHCEEGEEEGGHGEGEVVEAHVVRTHPDHEDAWEGV